MRKLLFAIGVFVALNAIFTVRAIPVDNGVEGEPEIECGPTSITVNFNTRNPFEGHVYVKGLFDQAGCRSDEHGRQVAGIELPFDSCNVARTDAEPKGVFVSTTVVISFHPQFVTKVDRAYRVQCFYMEADKTVSAQLEVSEITTQFQTQVVPMPVCKYEILEGAALGQPIQFATIAQQVYTSGTCDSETIDTFCAVVHSCVVDDGNGDTVQILNEGSCALDKFLLNNLEYPTDLTAGQEAHVYKYADRSQLFYQCQISITIKEPHSECARPKCAEPSGFNAVKVGAGGAGAGAPPPAAAAATPPPAAAPPAPIAPAIPARVQRLRTRQLRLLRKRRAAPGEQVLDVRTEFNALDISDKPFNLPAHIRHHHHLMENLSAEPQRRFIYQGGQQVCMSSFRANHLLRYGHCNGCSHWWVHSTYCLFIVVFFSNEIK
uniref:Cuticlin-1 n=1 Tax=Meloidogyne artiellia TaxID=42426 RepID=O18479_MELAT|nr:cuticlin-1 [Meloidogyne artiellia]